MGSGVPEFGGSGSDVPKFLFQSSGVHLWSGRTAELWNRNLATPEPERLPELRNFGTS
jgi:hypothetical protein